MTDTTSARSGQSRLDLANFVEVGLQRPVGDQLNVVEADNAAIVAMQRAVAWATDVDDVWVFAQRLPDNTAPAGFKGTIDVVGLVCRRRGREPERIRRANAKKFRRQVAIVYLLAQDLRCRSIDERRPCRVGRPTQSGRRHRNAVAAGPDAFDVKSPVLR